MSNITSMQLDIVSAEANIFKGIVKSITVTGSLGQLGIHPGHTALLTALKPGQLKAILENDKEEIFYLSGGMLEVQPESVSVLADTALRADDIDEAAAEAAKERAEKALAEHRADMEYSAALSELAQAAAQLEAAKMLRKLKGKR
ncbi:MAG: F0F1 ATP synthase subunit epsilon [Gammaproteobacteria bacterium RIFCSPHIGHO2_12_FULL_41_15]|nr:MAG: F0F1 ATP synthase subunit epsilon [Gammaproteobacteria bacterium RIFCSPHIGHO2_12_FULL_41_15]